MDESQEIARLVGTLKETNEILSDMRDALRKLTDIPGNAEKISLQFGEPKLDCERTIIDMPLILPDNEQDSYYISATDDLGLATSSLASGQTVSVVSSDPKTVVLTPDATPRNAPDGSPCIASGTVAPAQPPAAPNVAVTVTASILGPGGAPGVDDDGDVIAPVSDTVTVQPGLAHAEGILFGVPAASVPISASARRPGK